MVLMRNLFVVFAMRRTLSFSSSSLLSFLTKPLQFLSFQCNSGPEHNAAYYFLLILLSASLFFLLLVLFAAACCEPRNDPGFLSAFTAATRDVVSGITIHYYPLQRNKDRSCPPQLYTNLTTFLTLTDWLAEYQGFVAQGGAKGIDVILGETGSTSMGGCDGLSNRFIAGFIFIFELGSVAESHVVQVCVSACLVCLLDIRVVFLSFVRSLS